MSQPQSVWATLPPITAGALATATLMYPMDLLRALKMSSAADGNAAASTATLVKNFYATHGLKGFVSQGVGPEMLRATYMRVLKFFLFPITHEAVFKQKENKGTPFTKAVAGGLASLPEGFTIQPIEVSKIVLQLDKEKKYNNSGSAVMRDILKTRGWSGLFVGYFGIQYRQTSWTAAYFGTLQYFSEQSKQVNCKGRTHRYFS
jgi:solute carrier family 25 (mitochondrial 2-oxodicarboxylate transporter), member 21